MVTTMLPIEVMSRNWWKLAANGDPASWERC